jgi:hypothetical protein
MLLCLCLLSEPSLLRAKERDFSRLNALRGLLLTHAERSRRPGLGSYREKRSTTEWGSFPQRHQEKKDERNQAKSSDKRH